MNRACIITMAAAAVLVISGPAYATVLWEATFDDPGKVDGDTLTSTANTGTDGPAVGTTENANVKYATSHAVGGLAARFSGGGGAAGDTGERITFGTDADRFTSIPYDTDVTFSFSMNVHATGANSKPFGQYDTSLPWGNWQFDTARKLSMVVCGLGGGISYTFPEDEWVHIVVTQDRNGGVADASQPLGYRSLTNLYVNGEFETSYPFGRTWSRADWIQEIGAYYKSMTLLMDDVRLQTGFLDAAGAKALYEADMIPEPATMVLLAAGGAALLLRRRR